jgi:nitroreductase
MATILSPEGLNELIQQRRSVFPQDYTGERISDDIVRQILENARWAPTHKLTEPWRFVVFAGDGIKALARFQSDLYKTVTEKDGTFKEANYQKLLTKPLMSSHIIAVLMQRDGKKSVPEIEEAGAVFCALQNMYLTATAYGLGSYFSTGGITYFEDAKAFFNLEQEDKLMGFFHLGIPKRSYPESRRKPVEQVSHWVTSA